MLNFRTSIITSSLVQGMFFLAGLIFSTCLIAPLEADDSDENRVINRIAFGSCATQLRPCPIWHTIHDYQPDLLLLLGDNVYADVLDGRLVPSTPERIQAAYDQLAADEGFAKLRHHIPMLATWDDHDYGNNDAGVEWEHKEIAAEIFHDFFGTPTDSPLRGQAGVYQAKIYGPVGKRVQVIMLDTRYFRSELAQADETMPGFTARPYLPATGPDAIMLGEEQWAWLEQQLKQPAEIRILGSSIQVLSNEHPFEKWGNFPEERDRLFRLLNETAASGVIIISGDRHLGDISLCDQSIKYPLIDITASGLNQARSTWRMTEPNSLRVAGLPYGNHFGSIEIDWDLPHPQIKLQLRHEEGEIAVQARMGLNELQAPLPRLPLPAGILDPATALQQSLGEELTVQFRVLSGREIGNIDRIFLNSEKNFRLPTNFAVMIDQQGLTGDLATGGLDQFLNKTIRVTGKLSEWSQRKQIEVIDANQVEILED